MTVYRSFGEELGVCEWIVGLRIADDEFWNGKFLTAKTRERRVRDEALILFQFRLYLFSSSQHWALNFEQIV